MSKDGEKWTQIDERSNSAELNGSDFSSTFRVSKKLFARFCRLRQTGEYCGNNVNGGGCHLIIRRIEFYPLHSAVKHGQIETVKLLLQHKNIIVNKVDGSGKKPIDYADKN